MRGYNQLSQQQVRAERRTQAIGRPSPHPLLLCCSTLNTDNVRNRRRVIKMIIPQQRSDLPQRRFVPPTLKQRRDTGHRTGSVPQLGLWTWSPGPGPSTLPAPSHFPPPLPPPGADTPPTPRSSVEARPRPDSGSSCALQTHSYTFPSQLGLERPVFPKQTAQALHRADTQKELLLDQLID